MKKKLLFTSLILILSATSYADELDDALSGFDEPTGSIISDSAVNETEQGVDENGTFDGKNTALKNERINLTGSFGLDSSYNTAHSAPATGKLDYRGLSKLKMSADVLANIKISDSWKAKVQFEAFYDPIYEINGRSNYNADTLNTYESEIEFNEVYIEGELSDSVDLKIGRQIMVWGKSDSIRVTDVINPLDNREPGLVDIEDLRLPVLMSRLSYYHGDWSYNIVAIHEQRSPEEAAIDSEFFPTSALPFPANFVLPEAREGAIDFNKSTFAFSADGRFSGWDLSFYQARVTDSRWHFENSKTERVYGLVDMSGIATSFVVSGVLVKAELAYLSNLAYNTTANKKSRIDTVVGVEYMGINDWVLSLDYANRSIQNYEVAMANSPDLVQENTAQLAMRASYSFDHDNATVSLLSSFIGDGGEQGGFTRLWVDYAVSDQIKISTGFINYHTGTHLIWKAISNNDRLFFNAKYSY